jgi:hypothetical protein
MDKGDALHFSPAQTSVFAAKPTSNPHASASGNYLNISYWPEDFKIIRLHLPGYINTNRSARSGR